MAILNFFELREESFLNQSAVYEQIKLRAVQGSIYVKLKDGLDCLLVDDPSGDDEGIMFDQLHFYLTFLSLQSAFRFCLTLCANTLP